MGFGDITYLKQRVDSLEARLSALAVGGKLRQTGGGTDRVGVPQTHSHLGTGEGGVLASGTGILHKLTSSYEHLKTKFDGTTAPTVNDDITEGYVVGSRWIDVTNDKEYVCLDNTNGAAVWTETTGAGGGGGGNTLDQAYDQGGAGAGRSITIASNLPVDFVVATGSIGFQIRKAGDIYGRVSLGIDALDQPFIVFGDGTLAGLDTVLYRSAANELRTPDTFVVDIALKSDTINERTADAGVTVDGVLLKDSGIPEAAVTVHEAAITHDNLSGGTAATAHHTKYTDADAISAVPFVSYISLGSAENGSAVTP